MSTDKNNTIVEDITEVDRVSEVSEVVEVVKIAEEKEIDDYFFGGQVSESNSDDESEDEVESPKTDEEEEEVEDIVIGIDLGTTNSCVGIWRNKNLEIFPDRHGNRTIPSTVAFTNRTKYVGRDARNQTELNPENTYYEVKRIIGRKLEDESVQNDIPFLSYKLDKNADDGSLMLLSNLDQRKSSYTPEEISAMILTELKNMAEEYLKQPVDKAVITVPAYFNDSQRQATKDAATVAGIDCVRIINEPTAAALAYGLERMSRSSDEDINILVYDLGGGTLDCSILNISNSLFEVLASTGNTHLGGADFDNRLVTHCMNSFKKKHKIKKLKDLSSMSFQKLRKSCENAKKLLSETSKATIAVKDFYDNKDLLLQITRKQFEKLCQDLFILCLKSIEDVLHSAELEREEIDEIILVGGATRMPLIRNNLQLYFHGKEPNCNINADEVVAAGAAIQGYILSHASDPFSESVVLLDVIPLSLGVETLNGVMNVIIPRNSVIPIKRRKKYTTAEDYDTEVVIKIYEGERKMTKDNFLVGEFKLRGIESAPRGIAEISITFNIDINGIISVSAEDLYNSDNTNSITITGNKGRLSPAKIKELLIEAQNMDKIDKLEREKRQLYYEIEDLCSNIKVNCDNDEFKLKPKDVSMIMTDINKLFDWLAERGYLDRKKKDYVRVLERLKKKYGTLILRASYGDDNNIKSTTADNNNNGDNNNNATGTTLFGDDEQDTGKIYEEIENEELGLTGIDDEEKADIKQTREALQELCNSVFEVISSDAISIDASHIRELKDYIDDVLLWMHVREKIAKKEYIEKIDEINRACDKILEETNKTEVFEQNHVIKQIKTKRNELEQMCYAIKSSILSNVFSLKEDGIVALDGMIEDALEWLVNLDVKKKKQELLNEQKNKKSNNIEDNTTHFVEIEESVFQSKIDQINDMCNELYNGMMGVNITTMKENILDESADSVIYLGGDGGTTIDMLKNAEKPE